MKKLLILLFLPLAVFGQIPDATQTTSVNSTIRTVTTPGGITKGSVADRFQDLINSKVSRGETITASGTDSYSATGNSSLSYTYNFLVVVKFTNSNTGAATLNVNSLGAKSIKKDGSTTLDAGDIDAGDIHLLVYDGTNFQCLTIGGSGGGGGITNGAAANELMKSDGTNAVASGAFSTTAGNLTLGTGLTGSGRTILSTGSASDVDLNFNVKGGGTYNLQGTASGSGQLRLYEDTDDGTNFTAFKVGTQAGNLTYTLPTTVAASNGLPLTSTTAGLLSWGQIDLTTGVTGTLPPTNGGTGLATYAQGDIIYSSASNVLSALAKSTSATRYLSNTGSSNNPAWAQVDVTNGITGDLPYANLTQGSALSVLGVTGNSTADVASIAAGTDAHVLRRSGTSLGFGTIGDGSISGVSYSKIDFSGLSPVSSVDGDEVLPTTAGASMTPDQIRTAELVSVAGDHTLDLTDAWKTIMVNTGSSNNLTVPPNGTVAFPIGTRVFVRRIGAGATTFVQGAGVTITPSKGALTDSQYALMSLEKTATNTWYLDNGTGVTISSGDVTGALGYTPANSTNENLEWTQVTTTTDISFTTTTYADIDPSSGPTLQIPVTANVEYEYIGYIRTSASNSTEGHAITINGTNLTSRSGGAVIPATTTSDVARYTSGSFQDETATSSSAGSAVTIDKVYGYVKCTSSQNVVFQAKTEVGSGQSTTVKAGSYIRWRIAH